MMRRILFLLCLACATSFANAGELRPFATSSLAEIKTRFAGKPFMLTLWSLSCGHCAKELRLLGRLARDGHALPLVIVSTDTPEDATDIRAALARFGLAHLDTWVFADPVPERLRSTIDPAWRGELPRSYLFDAAHRARSHSGMLDETYLTNWLRGERPASRSNQNTTNGGNT